MLPQWRREWGREPAGNVGAISPLSAPLEPRDTRYQLSRPTDNVAQCAAHGLPAPTDPSSLATNTFKENLKIVKLKNSYFIIDVFVKQLLKSLRSLKFKLLENIIAPIWRKANITDLVNEPSYCYR